MNDYYQQQTLFVIKRALSKVFVLTKPGDLDHTKPLRASNMGKTYPFPSVNVTYYHKKRINRSFQAELPIVLALGIADLYDIDTILTMDLYQVDTFDEYLGKMEAFKAIFKKAVRAASNKKLDKKYDENFYRVFILYNLTLNYVRLYRPVPKEYVKIPTKI